MTHIESMDENAGVTLLARRARFDSTLAAFRRFLPCITKHTSFAPDLASKLFQMRIRPEEEATLPPGQKKRFVRPLF